MYRTVAHSLLLAGAMILVLAAPPLANRLLEARYLPAPSGYGARASAAVDMDRDGFLDLAIANSRDSTLSILIGNGDGFFSFRANLRTAQFPHDVAAGDLNADDFADVVVANRNSNRISVFLGHGDGTFAPRVDYVTGTRPQSLVINDLNEDLIPDLVLTNQLSSSVSIFMGAGNGTFAPRVDLIAGGTPVALAVGDLDGDVGLDLAVATSNPNMIKHFYNDGNGGFPATGDLTVGGVPADVAIADPDEDGYPDVMVLRDSPRDFIRFPSSDYGFSPTPLICGSAGAVPLALTLVDLNFDSHQDVAFVSNSSWTASIWLGDGDGGFQRQPDVETGHYPNDLDFADIDEDGRFDLVVTNESGAGLGDVYVVPGHGDGTFMKDVPYRAPVNPVAITSGDLNGDGCPDLVVTCNPQPSSQDSMTVYLNAGDGSMGASTTYFASASPGDVAIGDVNEDGIPDVVVAEVGSGQIGVRLGNGDGTLGNRLLTPTNSGSGQLVLAYMNGDSTLDAVVGSSGVTGVQLGLGNGQFAAPMNVMNGPNLSDLAVGDLNGDEFPDVVRAYTQLPAKLWVHLNQGDGSLGVATAYTVGVSGESPGPLAIGDISGDGIPDVLAAANTTLVTWRGVGNGSLTTRTFHPMGHSAFAAGMRIARLDEDARSDVVVSHHSSMGRVSVFTARADGGLNPEQLYGSEAYAGSVAVDDFNRDGRADLAVTASPGGSSPGYVCLLFGRETPVASVGEGPNVTFLPLSLSANPARGRVTIQLPASSSSSTLDVFDVVGRRIVRIHEGAPTDSPFEVTWSGNGTAGSPGPGIYFLRYANGRTRASAKLSWLGR